MIDNDDGLDAEHRAREHCARLDELLDRVSNCFHGINTLGVAVVCAQMVCLALARSNLDDNNRRQEALNSIIEFMRSRNLDDLQWRSQDATAATVNTRQKHPS
jgi:hypothetical protein